MVYGYELIPFLQERAKEGETPAETLVRLYQEDAAILDEIVRIRNVGKKGILVLCELFGFDEQNCRLFTKKKR